MYGRRVEFCKQDPRNAARCGCPIFGTSPQSNCNASKEIQVLRSTPITSSALGGCGTCPLCGLSWIRNRDTQACFEREYQQRRRQIRLTFRLLKPSDAGSNSKVQPDAPAAQNSQTDLGAKACGFRVGAHESIARCYSVAEARHRRPAEQQRQGCESDRSAQGSL